MSIHSWFCRHQMVEQPPSGPTCRIFLCSRCGLLRSLTVPCVHAWMELERHLTKPIAHIGGVTGGQYTEAMWFAAHTGRMELMQGKVTIIYRCANCQKHELIVTAGA